MNQTRKTITTLSLLIIFLTIGSILLLSAFAGAWLYTYKTFTKRTPVAEIEIGAQMQDENGPYTDVTIQFYQSQSALAAILVGEKETTELGEELTYRLYGDEVSIDGPTIKLKNELLLLNLENAYKIVRIRSEYSDPDLEDNRDIENMPRRYDFSDGVQGWREFDETFRSSTPLGWFYRLFVDTSTIQSSGVFVPEADTSYTLYVTTNGFTFDQE